MLLSVGRELEFESSATRLVWIIRIGPRESEESARLAPAHKKHPFVTNSTVKRYHRHARSTGSDLTYKLKLLSLNSVLLHNWLTCTKTP